MTTTCGMRILIWHVSRIRLDTQKRIVVPRVNTNDANGDMVCGRAVVQKRILWRVDNYTFIVAAPQG